MGLYYISTIHMGFTISSIWFMMALETFIKGRQN
jgi:hypothetical protein